MLPIATVPSSTFAIWAPNASFERWWIGLDKLGTRDVLGGYGTQRHVRRYSYPRNCPSRNARRCSCYGVCAKCLGDDPGEKLKGDRTEIDDAFIAGKEVNKSRTEAN